MWAIIYTCQSCPGWRGAGAWPALVSHGGMPRALSGREDETTNDRLELRAALAGLTLLSEVSESGQPGEVLLVTRNQNLWRGLTAHLDTWHRNGWRTRAGQPIGNRDLWERLYALTRAHTVRCVLSRDYDGPDLTGQAQRLAARAARGARHGVAATARLA